MWEMSTKSRWGRPTASAAKAGGVTRLGPAHCTGEARLLNTGSVSQAKPCICTNTVEWPAQTAWMASPARDSIRGGVVRFCKR